MSEPVGIHLDNQGQWHRIGDGANHPVLAGITSVMDGAHDLVEIPSFYVRVEHDEASTTWTISDIERDGYSLHPAFRRPDGSAAPAIRIGAYATGNESGQPVSKRGLKPWTRQTLSEAKASAAGLGEGWRLWSVYELSAVKLLALIDIGHPDMQTAIGRGNVDGYGICAGGESDAAWRGVHELWGNVWQFVDGLTFGSDGTMRVWSADAPSDAKWVDTGTAYGPGTKDGWIAGFHNEAGDGFDLGQLFMPADITGERDDALVPDWAWGRWGEYESILLHGNWSSGARAGLWCVHCHAGASHADAGIGSRLAKVL